MTRAAVDIASFARHAVPEYVCDSVPRFHKEIFDAFADPANKRIAVVAPRGFAKSTLSQVAILHQIAFCPQGERRYILVVSESQSQSSDYLDNIKNIIDDGDHFKNLFPFVKPGSRWGAESIITSTGVKVEVLGTRQRVRGRNFRGMRPTTVFLDDFESESNCGSAEDRARVRRWIRAAVVPAMARGKGRLIACGTIIHEDSYLNRLMDASITGWKKFFFRAKRHDGDPHPQCYGEDGMLWGDPHLDQDRVPVAFDHRWWSALKEEFRAEGQLDSFAQEYQNQVRPGNPVFDRFNYYDSFRTTPGGGVEILQTPGGEWVPCATFLGVDPSTREHSKADFCVLMPIAVDSKRNIYQLPYTRKRFGRDVKKIVDEIFSLHDRFRFRAVGIEVIGSQVYISGEVKRQQRHRNKWFRVVELNPTRGKDSKIYSLQPRFEAGLLHIHPQKSDELQHELMNYPRARHDDCPDALWMACEVGYPIAGLTRKLKERATMAAFSWKVA